MDNVSMVLIQEVKGHMSVDDQGVNWLSIHHARILFLVLKIKYNVIYLYKFTGWSPNWYSLYLIIQFSISKFANDTLVIHVTDGINMWNIHWERQTTDI